MGVTSGSILGSLASLVSKKHISKHDIKYNHD